MDLPDLKQLNKMIALCRKQGVKIIELGQLKITLSDEAIELKPTTQQKMSYPDTPIESESPSRDDLLFWSTGMVGTNLEETKEN